MIITAKIPILYKGKQYSVGETLPTDNELMINLWIEAGSVKVEEDAKELKLSKEDDLNYKLEEENLEEDTKENEEDKVEGELIEESQEEPIEAPKAKSVTAQAGLAGEAINSETEENVVGRVPKTASRAKGKNK